MTNREDALRDAREEMLAAWLQGEDNAKEQTWSTLVDAVRQDR